MNYMHNEERDEKMAKKNNPYYEDFKKMADLSCEAAKYLHQVLKEFNPDDMAEKRRVMHAIEHQEDEIKHGMMKRLVKEFITPIDREDIIHLSDELDDVTDKIDDILIRMYMYNIKEMRPVALEFSDVIVRCCEALQTAIQEFTDSTSSDALRQALINVNTMEEEGDAIYISAVRNLYESNGSSLEVVAWSELIDRLEDCCDACEDVAGVIELIAMKNS
jgi:predicted phosphate transport protein (TIGR00153 family)